MTIKRIDNSALECVTPEGLRLGFPTGISTRRFSSADTVSIKNSDGIIVKGSGEISPWPIERYIEYEGDMVALGPWIEGSKPFENETVSLEMIKRLIPGIQSLKSTDFPLKGLYNKAIRWLPDGGVLIYPPKLAAWMSELNQNAPIWVHPDYSGEMGWSFSLGVMAWWALTGSDPFAGEREENRRERIRRRILPPMEALVPGIAEDAEVLIRRSLVGSEDASPTLDEWNSFMEHQNPERIILSLPEKELHERKSKALSKAILIEKKFKSRRWFRHSGWKLFTALAVTAAVLTFVSAPLRKMLEAPVTAGMTTMEVANTFYDAINAMDTEIMEDCLAKKVGKGDVNLITTMYVTSKMRQGYEGINAPPLAENWINEGKPELPEGTWPWGISGLVLTELKDGRIKAHYLFWTPPEGGTESPVKSWSVSRTDILSFTQGKKSWEISKIQRSTAD